MKKEFSDKTNKSYHKNIESFKVSSEKYFNDDFSFFIVDESELENDVLAYEIIVEDNVDISTCVDRFLSMLESDKFEEDSILIVQCGGYKSFLTKGLSLENILLNLTVFDNQSIKNKNKRKTDKEREQQIRNSINANENILSLVRKKDAFEGFKQKIAAGNSDVMRILDRLIMFVGKRKMEGYFFQMDKEQVDTNEMYDAMVNDSLGSVAILSSLVKNRDARLITIQEEEKKKKNIKILDDDYRSF